VKIVQCAVEGDLDEVVARRLLGHVSLDCGTVYGLMGKQHLRQRIEGYAAAAVHAPWFVLVDLDQDAPCAGALVAEWVPNRPAMMRLRVAVREAEAWLLADRATLARFLSVSRDVVPRTVDDLADPKNEMVGLSRRSRSRAIRDGMAPRMGSGRTIGPLYVSELSRFVREHWDIETAAQASESLSRCLAALRSL
jgi:hypothetical protein